MIPVVRSRYVNLEVHFQKQWKMFTCERFWSKSDVLDNVCKELNIPQREKDQYLPQTVELFRLNGDQAATINDFESLQDGQKVLVDVQQKKPVIAEVAPRTAKPVIGGMA